MDHPIHVMAGLLFMSLGAMSVASAQSPTAGHFQAAGHQHHRSTQAGHEATAYTGPHGGTVRQSPEMAVESVVTPGGIDVYVYDSTLRPQSSLRPLSVERARGAVSMRIQGVAKRYRYDLLPDGSGALRAPVNLSKIGGRQVELEIRLVGIDGSNRQVMVREVATVPASPAQLAAAAIARQKVCPVSGKPLGSMGQPIAVAIGKQTVYVCCAGCVAAVKANPTKYATGRPPIVVTTATKADSPLIARQATCPVMDEPLGSMGDPVKVLVGDKPIFLCCKGCVKKVQAEPEKYLAAVYGATSSANNAQSLPSHAHDEHDHSAHSHPGSSAVAAVGKASPAHATVPAGGEAVRAGVFKVTAADAPFIAAQKKCPVMDEPLDAMGGPYKVHAAGRAIYICCPGCAKKIAAEPQTYLQVLAQQGVTAPLLR